MNFVVYTKSGENPVPYKRTTQKQMFVDKRYRIYTNWKAHVVATFIKEFKTYPKNVFKPKIKYYVDIVVYYKDMTHGDTDNVFKGILDALFAKPLNDKYIAGSMDYFYDKENPRVEIKISQEA